MKYRVDSLGFWRTVCTYMIVALHYGYSTGWKLAVEFFFIVSGFLMAYEYDEKRTPYKLYIKKRVLRLWPHYIFSFIVFIVFYTLRQGYSFTQLLVEIKHSVLEIFMVQILGLGDYASNHGAVWYVSSLFVSSIILYAVLDIKNRHVDNKNIMLMRLSTGQQTLLLLFIIMGYCSKFIFGDMCIATYESKYGLSLIPGLIRGISEMSVGIESYLLGAWLDNKGFFNKYRGLWIGLELMIIASTIIYTYYRLDRYVLVIMMFAVSVIIGFFVEHNEAFSKLTSKFSRYTYPIYLNHPIVLIICVNLPLWGVLVIVTVYSMLTLGVVDRMKKIFMKGKVI